MSVTKLPSGRWRAQAYHDGRNLSVGTFATKREAKAAAEDKRRELAKDRSKATVADFAARWTSDPLFAPPKESTALWRAERIRAFVKRYGTIPMADVGDSVVSEWIAGGRNLSTVPPLRAMFNAAASAKGGRVVEHNPFAGLGLHKTKGNQRKDPPSEEQVWELIRAARRVSCPGFAAWLQVACFTGMRPGELDALRWDRVDFDAGTIRVVEQWNAASGTWTTPKNGQARTAILTPHAREALLGLARESEFCFVNMQRKHWTAAARGYHWKAVRAAVGFEDTLYLATRHFAGWYMTNMLGLAPEDVAVALGHTDGGYQVRTLYGHLDERAALERVRAAYAGLRAEVRQLRAVGEDG